MSCLPSTLETLCILSFLPSSLSNAWATFSWYSRWFPGIDARDRNFCNLLRVSFSRKGWVKQDKAEWRAKQARGLTVQSHRELWSINCIMDLVLSWGKGWLVVTFYQLVIVCQPPWEEADIPFFEAAPTWRKENFPKKSTSSKLLAASTHSS